MYKQLESKQINPILRELSYKNISYNVVQNGKQFDLQVDEDQIDEAKLVLAIKGLPSGTVKGYEIFDEASNLGVTEFDKRIRLIELFLEKWKSRSWNLMSLIMLTLKQLY